MPLEGFCPHAHTVLLKMYILSTLCNAVPGRVILLQYDPKAVFDALKIEIT